MADSTFYTSCIRIERTDGVILCLTDLDQDLLIDDTDIDLVGSVQIYISAAGYTPTNVQTTSNNSVNNADVEGILSAVGVQREDIIGGLYDFARLHVFLWDWKNSILIKKLGTGHWGEATIKDGEYTAEFRSLSQQLQQTVGRTFNPECDEQLGGPRCTINLSSYTETGTVTSVNSNSSFEASVSGGASGEFNYGRLTFASGNNTGIYMEVKAWDATTFVLQLPMAFTIQVGDTFSVYKGCDKRLATCKDIFSNNINFQGFPYIPSQDAITRFGGQ